MQTTDSALPLGNDGLYYHPGDLVGIQNGVVPHRGDLLYSANSQWERFGPAGRAADSRALERPVVLRLPL